MKPTMYSNLTQGIYFSYLFLSQPLYIHSRSRQFEIYFTTYFFYYFRHLFVMLRFDYILVVLLCRYWEEKLVIKKVYYVSLFFVSSCCDDVISHIVIFHMCSLDYVANRSIHGFNTFILYQLEYSAGFRGFLPR